MSVVRGAYFGGIYEKLLLLAEILGFTAALDPSIGFEPVGFLINEGPLAEFFSNDYCVSG